MDASSPPPILHLIDRIAARAVIHLDDMTLGQHPDATAREAGELALLDWTVAGGAIVSAGPDASLALIQRTSPARALGAALAAAVRVDDQICDDLPLLSGLAVSADALAGNTAGGPADAPLRLAMCARGLALGMLALGMLGEEGDMRRGYNRDFEQRSLGGGLDRPEAWLGVDGRDFADLHGIAFLPLTDGDRALLAAVS